MKKFIVVTFVVTFVLALNSHFVFAYPQPIAVITNYEQDSLAGQITIVRANGKPSSAEELLYPNDKITGNFHRVKLKLDPYATCHSTGDAYVIIYNPPSWSEKIKSSAMSVYYSFAQNVEYITRNISRGVNGGIDLNPQPGFDVTLLSKQKVTFSWYEPDNKNFSIQDDKGKVIFQKDISGTTSTEIDIGAVKLQADKEYFWSVDGDSQTYKIKLLDKETETEIFAELAAIDSEEISANEKIFKKATYLQFISDTYPAKIDLYWFSAQLLFDVKIATEDDKNYQKFLLHKCSSHLNEQMNKK